MSIKPEERVRQDFISRLRELGWRDDHMQWRPEWSIPATPHDLCKREQGRKYATAGRCDLVLFADESRTWPALSVICEFKAPDIDAGRTQLERYLSSEPQAKLGLWSNGERTLALYKTPDGKWREEENPRLPGPHDDVSAPPIAPLTWETMISPRETDLTGAFKRLLNTVVSSDTRATRREKQLNEMVNVVLVKLESDSRANDDPSAPVRFQVIGGEQERTKVTADSVRKDFVELHQMRRTTIFSGDDQTDIQLDDETIYQAVVALSKFQMLFVNVDVVAKAFQVFRTKALKSGEGQFLTPTRVVRPAIMALDIRPSDNVIDPAAGTGGFVLEAMRQVRDFYLKSHPNRPDYVNQLVTKWANERAWAVDIDTIGVKLTRAMMLTAGDGSSHSLLGDAVRSYRWAEHYKGLESALADEQYTVVVTNPPFGEQLKIRAEEARKAGFTITQAAASARGKKGHVDLEIGLIFLERAWRLLQHGGRLGIVLPETYFFSHSYRWLPEWLEPRLKMRGMLNIPMEAFQEFCRAKTNFYIFEKIGAIDTVEKVDA